jgi:flagellar biogenesis protein FliO
MQLVAGIQPPAGTQVTEQIGMVLLVFALLGGVLWLAKKRGMAAWGAGVRRGGNGRRLEVLERVPLTAQHALHLVRVSNRTVLIATAPSSCTLLDAPAALDDSTSPAFSSDLLRSS